MKRQEEGSSRVEATSASEQMPSSYSRIGDFLRKNNTTSTPEDFPAFNPNCLVTTGTGSWDEFQKTYPDPTVTIVGYGSLIDRKEALEVFSEDTVDKSLEVLIHGVIARVDLDTRELGLKPGDNPYLSSVKKANPFFGFYQDKPEEVGALRASRTDNPDDVVPAVAYTLAKEKLLPFLKREIRARYRFEAVPYTPLNQKSGVMTVNFGYCCLLGDHKYTSKSIEPLFLYAHTVCKQLNTRSAIFQESARDNILLADGKTPLYSWHQERLRQIEGNKQKVSANEADATTYASIAKI